MSNSFLEKKKSNIVEFTISEFSKILKKTIENSFNNLYIRGEISGYKGPHASGHIYFSLKDNNSKLEAVIWKSIIKNLYFKVEEGMEIVGFGKITTYSFSSKYQFIIESFRPSGIGTLVKLLENRKNKLSSEGLFDKKNKKPLPFLPKIIGVITSLNGVVIRDIIHRIKDRFPMKIIVWPVRVQGESSAKEISNAIYGFNNLNNDFPKPDLIIVARGGGSLEDLWSFNDEIVVRAASSSKLPLISAIGHETDWTLIDYVSDKRAPTPTGAAEISVPVKKELESILYSLGERLKKSALRMFDFFYQNFFKLSRYIFLLQKIFFFKNQSFKDLKDYFLKSIFAKIHQKKNEYQNFRQKKHLYNVFLFLNQKKSNFLLIKKIFFKFYYFNFFLIKKNYFALSKKPIKNLSKKIFLVKKKKFFITFYRFYQIFLKNFFCKKSVFYEKNHLMKILSYQETFNRGFLLAFDQNKKQIRKSSNLLVGEKLNLYFSDKKLVVVIQKEIN